MTDFQLSIMKTLERQVLVAAIEQAREAMPEDAPREISSIHKDFIRPVCYVLKPCPNAQGLK